jgi:DNA polymerase sigma
MKKRYDEVDQVVVPMETYKEPPARRPSENVFEFIELIDPERAERIKKRRDEAVRRANEVLRKHHDLGKPIEEISEDTVRWKWRMDSIEFLFLTIWKLQTREVTEEVRKVFDQPEPLSEEKSPQNIQNDEDMMTPTNEAQQNEIPEDERDIFALTPLPADVSALSANVSMKPTPSSPTTRETKKRGRKRTGTEVA